MPAMVPRLVQQEFSAETESLKPNEQSGFLLRDPTVLPSPTCREEDFQCPLCRLLLYSPVTTPCGHTYCKACILRGMEHDNKCPLCRAVINVTPDIGVNVLMQATIQSQFPRSYAARKAEAEAELADELGSLPLFMLGTFVLFPQQQLPLHVFEARYQTMMRRCLQGSKRFGVVPTDGPQLAPVGVCALIVNSHWYPDGRCLLQTKGCQRFRRCETWDSEGYKVAKVEFFDDEPTPTDAASVERLQAKLRALIEAAESHFGAQTIAKWEAKAPAPRQDASGYSWWLGSVLQIPVQGKVVLLGLTTAEARLDFLLRLVDVLRQGGSFASLGFGA